MDNLKGSSHQWQILGKLGTALFEIHNRLSRNSTTTVVVYIKKGKKISDDHVCHHFTHSSLSLSKLSALCGRLHIGKIDNLKGSSHQLQILGKLGTAL